MLRVVAHGSAAAARQYYAEGLKKEDYYSEGQEIVGKWHGEAARLLGLSGDVTPEAFAALVDNRHPETGERLTQRTRSNRRVGYDLNFHAPKSLSVLYAMTQNPEILSVFRQAVTDTMVELEKQTETRIRKKGAMSNRITGNLVWAEFIHFTSRPVDGVPDPHLHAHCFAMNATFDQKEGQWKAAEFAAIKRAAHYAEAAFHTRLAAGIADLGYGIERKKNGWEVQGISASVLAKFSRRTAQIEDKAREMGITDAKAKDALGAATREGKRHGLTFPDLLVAWGQRLTTEEKVQISKACFDKPQSAAPRVNAEQSLDYAIAKVFEKQSVVERGHILAAALRFGAGQVTPDQIKAEFEKRGFIGRKVGDQHLCTTIDVLAEEIALVAMVRNGRNTAMRLGRANSLLLDEKLSEEQRAAVRHILTSTDQVIAIKGGAGVGKTTLMQEAAMHIGLNGLQFFAFAPSAVASRETLREAGFAEADTVAQLLVNPQMQKRIQGQVVWIDEAGLIGTRDLLKVMELVGPSTRVILTGDTAQHTPVARGDAFRNLQSFAGLKIAQVSQIRRQQIEEYREAIKALSKGDLRVGFRRLEALGAIVEIQDDNERYRELASDYLALGRGGSFPPVIAPVHKEGLKVTEAIRAARREAGQLGAEKAFRQYQNLKWDEADRGVSRNYQSGMMVQFEQNCKGIKRGEIFHVKDVVGDQVRVMGSSGRVVTLPLNERSRFQVYEQKEIRLAPGDLIRLTRNGFSENKKRLSNGNLMTIEKFGKNGEIILQNGAVLGANFGHLAYGYYQTSHSSQSMSVKDVLVAQSKDSFVASSLEQFYVSCSRGKETIRIYTDNREMLREAVGATSQRLGAMELTRITAQDLSTFMPDKMGGKEWSKAIMSRRGLDGTKTFLQQLVERRKMEPRKEGEQIEWKGYVEMRRGLKGADGKNRSKGYNSQPSKGVEKEKGHSQLRPVGPTDAFHEKNKAAHEKKQSEAQAKKAPKADKTPRENRFSKALQATAQNFQKIADKVKGSVTPKTKEVRMGHGKMNPLQQSTIERSVKRAAKQQDAPPVKKPAPPSKTQQIKPPVIRK